jgi:hypothetical protein
MTALKLINYRGGLARFYLPSSWIEEYDQAGRGTFFGDKPDSGTLRISVLDADTPLDDGGPNETVDDVIAQISETEFIARLTSGAAIAQSRQTSIEDGQELLLHTWHIGVGVTPTHFRIIVFTYTVLAAQEFDPNVRQELAMLDRSISEGEYPAVKRG